MRTLFFLVALMTMAMATLPLRAEEAPLASGAAAEVREKSASGCMPDGGCCGACTAARVQGENQALQPPHGAETNAAEAGGCPCKRAQQQKGM